MSAHEVVQSNQAEGATRARTGGLAGTDRIPSRHKELQISVALAVVLGVAWVDYATGPDLSFSLFYLVPIVLAGWYVGRTAALATALLAPVCWFWADISFRPESYLAISIWNSFTRLAIFVALGQLVALAYQDRVRTRELLGREARTARLDGLTGLPNSRAFLEILERELARSRRAAKSIGMLYLDLDNFKAVNDRYGHTVGDELLRRVGALLSTTTRATDVAARLGGDEFAVLAWDTDADALREIGERIVTGIAQLEELAPGSGIGASVGARLFHCAPDNVDDLIREADAAMYEAKLAGMHTIVCRQEPHIGAPLTMDPRASEVQVERVGSGRTLMWPVPVAAAVDRTR